MMLRSPVGRNKLAQFRRHSPATAALPELREACSGLRFLRFSSARGGFTLMELLIVLAVIVLVSAIALPLIQKPLQRQEIQKAANAVRTKLFRARIGAMSSSHTYAFQYLCRSGDYRLAPADDASASPGEIASNSGGPGATPDAGDGPRPESGSLPEGIHFMPDNTPDPDASDPEAENAPQNSGDGWSDPIMFYPDGTTSDARFIVASDRGFAVHITLRSVTGNVVLGGITKITK